jgi:hypothetical protein
LAGFFEIPSGEKTGPAGRWLAAVRRLAERLSQQTDDFGEPPK